jgi:ankyrin repeat protein
MGVQESKLTADDDHWIDGLLSDNVDANQLVRLERTLSVREQRGIAIQHLRARNDRAAIVTKLTQLDARRAAILLPLLICADSDAVLNALFAQDRADLLASVDIGTNRHEAAEAISSLILSALAVRAFACVTVLLRAAPLKFTHKALSALAERAPHLLEAVSEPALYAIDFDSEHHETLLFTMVARGNLAAVTALLERGVSPTATTARCETPLFAAMRNGNIDIVRLLIQARDGVLVRNIDGQSALDLVDAESELAVAFRAELAKWPEKQRDAVFRFFANTPPHLSPLRIQVCSDLHVEFSDTDTRFEDVLETDPNCHLLALLGDIGVVTKPSYRAFVQSCADTKHFQKVWVVLGNHEYYRGDMFLSLREAAEVCQSRGDVLQLLHRSSTVVSVGDRRVRVIGSTLWSHVPPEVSMAVSLSLNDYRQISNQVGIKVGQLTLDNLQTIESEREDPAQRIIRDQYIAQAPHDMQAFLKREERSLLNVMHTNAVHAADLAFFNAECRAARDAGEDCVILCHHAPLMRHGVGSPEYWFADCESAFSTDLRASLIDPNPNLRAIVYGHTHWAQDETLLSPNGAACRIVSNPRGYKTEKRSKLFKKAYILEF